MKAETLARLYNIGLFHRTIVNSPDHRIVSVDIDDEPKLMKLSELEEILTANKDRLRIILANEKPIPMKRVAQPFAHTLPEEPECPTLKLAQ